MLIRCRECQLQVSNSARGSVAYVVLSLSLFAGGLTACSAPLAPNRAADPSAAASIDSAEPANAAMATSPVIAHSWISHENGEYGYPVGISDDARKAGQAADEVIMYRYLGFSNGAYTLFAPDTGIVATCPDPCTVITETSGYSTERVAYNPESVIGAAFEDALGGQLEPWQPSHPPPEPSYPPASAPPSQQTAEAPASAPTLQQTAEPVPGNEADDTNAAG